MRLFHHLKHEIIIIAQHGTIEEIIKNLDSSKYPIPDDWLEPSERAEKRKQAKMEAKARKEARAKEGAKKTGAAKEEEVADDGDVKKEIVPENKDEKRESDANRKENGVAEKVSNTPPKRERDTEDGNDSEEEIDDTPPMYRQARELFLKPEVGITHAAELSNVCL